MSPDRSVSAAIEQLEWLIRDDLAHRHGRSFHSGAANSDIVEHNHWWECSRLRKDMTKVRQYINALRVLRVHEGGS